MKLHFEPSLDYQLQAIEAVCDIFHGQETCRTEFTVVRDTADPQQRMGFAENDLGIGNRLTLLDDELLANLHAIQLRHGLAPSAALASGDFTVEMETGTGKTYVYLRTVFELNKRYGFTKFVIVVPSVAIKEGVYHTIETAADHLRGLYAGVPFDYFLYDSAKLGQVRNFATSPQIQVMVMTVGAINKFSDEQQAQAEEADEAARREKSKNVMYRASEKTGGEKPIDLIRATSPTLIVDEPQSVEGGLDGKGKKAMDRMNPLCNLRYSATPKEAHHMVFKLNAVDAYERKLRHPDPSGVFCGGRGNPIVPLWQIRTFSCPCLRFSSRSARRDPPRSRRNSPSPAATARSCISMANSPSLFTPRKISPPSASLPPNSWPTAPSPRFRSSRPSASLSPPFFVVTRAVDPGLSKVLREQIVPRLLSEVPGQPAQSALAADRLLSRFALVFDREGYSPELFGWLRKQRVAVLTYHKSGKLLQVHAATLRSGSSGGVRNRAAS